MEVSFSKRRKILKNTDPLELTPFRKYDYRINEKGLVVVLIPKFKNQRYNFLIPRHKSINTEIKLDEMGTTTWMAINGINKTKDICAALIQQHGSKEEEAEERTLKFLSQLFHHRLISFHELTKK